MSFFLKIWRYITGYVTVVVEGYFLEKFTNLCAINTVPFWNVKRYGSAKMVGRTTIKGFKQMRLQARKCGCRVSVYKKRGCPFVLHKYRKRKIFVVGLLFFLCCIKVAGMFVWSIEVTGNTTIADEEIIRTLEEIGVKRWVLKDSLSVRDLANIFMTKRSDISWIGIDIKGIRANVEVVEKEDVPDKIDENSFCDIIAVKPALIVSIDTYKGKTKVNVGDVVDKGTVLVEGIMEMQQFPEKTQYVHALASIKGRVWYEKTRILKLSDRRANEEVETFAYNLAYKNIINKMPSDAEIINVSKSVAYTDEKVIVTVTAESIEEIGVEAAKKMDN